jgi:ECF transporter S component (folate family)
VKLLAMFRNSALELKNVRCLTTTGILCAIYIVLNAYAPQFSEILKVTIGYLALAAIGMLYGPVVAVIAAIPCDIVTGILSPFPFVAAFIPSRMLEALIYGIFLYRYGSRGATGSQGGAVWAAWQTMRIVAARVIAVFLCYYIINSLIALYFILPPERATQIMTENSFWIWAWLRSGWINLAKLPVDLALMFTFLPTVNAAYFKTLYGFTKERSVS